MVRRLFGTDSIGTADSYRGHIDLIQQKAYLWDGNSVTVGDIPAEMADDVEMARMLSSKLFP